MLEPHSETFGGIYRSQELLLLIFGEGYVVVKPAVRSGEMGERSLCGNVRQYGYLCDIRGALLRVACVKANSAHARVKLYVDSYRL